MYNNRMILSDFELIDVIIIKMADVFVVMTISDCLSFGVQIVCFPVVYKKRALY